MHARPVPIAIAVLAGIVVGVSLQPRPSHASSLTLYGQMPGVTRDGQVELTFQFEDPDTHKTVAVRHATVNVNEGSYIANMAPLDGLGLYAMRVSEAGVPAAPISYVTLQAASPGSKETGNVNISGTLIAGKIGVGTNTPAYPVTVLSALDTYGVWSKTAGTAVLGQSNKAGTGYGGYFSASGASARGIYAEASSVSGLTYSGYFVNRSSVGKAVYGLNSSTSGDSVGIKGETKSPSGMGILGVAPPGVFDGAPGTGVTGQGSYGVSAFATDRAFYGRTSGSGSIGAVIVNDSAGNGAEIGGPNGAVFTGTGFTTRDFSGITAADAPLAYGYVNSGGVVQNGSGTSPARMMVLSKTYTLTFTGYSFSYSTFTACVTPGSGGGTPNINSNTGNMILTFVSPGATNVAQDFYVVIYKSDIGPPGPAPVHHYKSDREWAKKDPAAFEKWMKTQKALGSPVVARKDPADGQQRP